MSTVVRRHSNPVAEVLSWLDNEAPFTSRTDGSPLVRIEDYVDDNSYVLRAEAPGVDPEKDLTVTVSGDILTIRGERHEEQQDKRYREFRYGEFARSVQLPQGARTDDIRAAYTDGVLEVRVTIDTEATGTRTVPIARDTE